MKQRIQRMVVGCLIFGFALLTAAHFFSLSREGSADFDALESEPYAFESKDDPGARELLEWAKYHDPATGEIPKNVREQELALAVNLPTKDQEYSRLAKTGKANKIQLATWSRRGPYNIGGRTRALALDVTNSSIILAGGVSGGMWRSVNGGAGWSKTTTPNDLHSVSCLAQDTRAGNTNIWYHGTGENFGNSASRFASYRGDGVFKSTDNGSSWTRLPSTATNSPQTLDLPWDYTWNIAVSPTNGAVYVAALGAIMRSTDGGTNWAPALGSVTDASGPRFTDVTVTSTGVLYASLSSLNLNSQAGVAATNRGIWRSTDGLTWTNITPVTPVAWPNVDYRRIVLGVAPSNQNVLYVLAETPGAGINGHSFWKYVYVSGDGSGSGGSWENRSANLPNESGAGGNAKFDSQNSYDLVVKVKPDNEDVVFIGGTNLYRSTDGWGTTTNWKRIGGYLSPADYTKWPIQHPDMHVVTFDPTNPSALLNANDGGVYRTSDDMAQTVNWISLNNGYFNTQFYAIAIDHARSGNDIIVGGMQDNGTWFTNTLLPNVDWIEEFGGDGAYCAIADSGSSYYFSSQSGNVYRFLLDDLGAINNTPYFTKIVPLGVSNFLFVNPFVLDPTNTRRMYFVEGKLTGTSADYGVLWRNSDLTQIPLGSNSATSVNWTKLVNTQVNGNPITTLAASRTSPSRVYYGTNNGQVYRIDNADAGNPSPVDLFTGKGLPSAYVSCIAIDPANSDKALAVFSNYSVQSLYYTTDGGTTWTPVGGNLEENPSTGLGGGPSTRWAAIVPVGGINTYIVGTSVGVYSTTTLNGVSTVWSQEGASVIGNVPVDMIDTRISDGLLVVGTHGSGIFSANLVTSVQLVEATIPKEFTLLQNYPNPFNPSTTIRYTIPERTSVRLRIYNVEGREIATLVNEEQAAGTYEAKWNGTNASGVPAASGVYYSRLESGDKITARKMILMK